MEEEVVDIASLQRMNASARFYNVQSTAETCLKVLESEEYVGEDVANKARAVLITALGELHIAITPVVVSGEVK